MTLVLYPSENIIRRRVIFKKNSFMFQGSYVSSLGLLDYIWRGEHFLTPGTGNSLGCITPLSSPYKIMRSLNFGKRGHALALTKNDQNKVDSIVVNLYTPNGFDDSKLTFFEEVVETIIEMSNSYGCNKVILGGDLNLDFSDDEVPNRLILNAERRVANAVKEMFNHPSLTDGWNNVERKSFTWGSSRTGSQSFLTLDRVCYLEIV